MSGFKIIQILCSKYIQGNQGRFICPQKIILNLEKIRGAF
jgi:hypothetical protein